MNVKNFKWLAKLNIFLFLIGFYVGNAQSVEMDTTYRPRTYQLQVEQFKSYPNSTNDIIFLGNSLTAYTHWNELLEVSNIKNRGISGDTSFGILERITEITEGQPAMIFLLIGINDISRNVPSHLIIRNYKKIIERIQKDSPKTKIYLQTLLPVNNTFTRYSNHYNKDGEITKVNNGLKKLSTEKGVDLIDIHPHFLDQDNRLDKRYTEEGLHLNAYGYNLWAKILLPYLKQ